MVGYYAEASHATGSRDVISTRTDDIVGTWIDDGME